MERERNSRGSKRPRKKVCMFCADRVEEIDYKDIARLRKCMTGASPASCGGGTRSPPGTAMTASTSTSAAPIPPSAKSAAAPT